MSPFTAAAAPAELYQDSHLVVDFQAGTVRVDGLLLKIPRKEFDLLSCLLRHSGELVAREALLSIVWGYGAGVRTRTLDVHIRRLRKSLEPYGKLYIETVFGIGYRFQPCPSPERPDVAGFIPLEGRSGSGAWRWSGPAQ